MSAAPEPSAAPHDDAPISLMVARALHARYGAAAPKPEGPWNDTLTTLLAHRSVRAYQRDKKLPAGALEAIIAAAQSAASSSNLQTWSVVVIENEARKARLSELAGGQKHIRQAPLFLVWLADLSRAQRLAQQAERPDDGLPFIETFLVAAIDATLAAQNAVIALESMGLSSVYIGAMRNHPQAVAAELALPSHVAPIFGLCVGYEDKEVRSEVKPRLPQDIVVHRETYSPDLDRARLAAYDQTMKSFQCSQGMAPIGWVPAVLDRLGSVAALNGRDKLLADLRALGFGLR